MNIQTKLILASFCALAASAAALAEAAALMPAGGKPAGYKLVWADEFDQPGLPDPAKWEYDIGMNQTGWANEELQYYAKGRLDNTRVSRGRLHITARRERLGDAPDFGGQAYTSGRLYTRGKFEFTYGFVEVRARLPCGLGSWPAIWMLGTTEGWPEQGEIDIMEHTGMKKGEVLASLHTGAFNWPNKTQISAPTRVESVCDAFHNYQLRWDADRMVIGVDDKNYLQFANPHDGDHHKWPFSDPHYLILNLAIGGMMGGPVDDKIFPATMEVEYVRVYQR
ncbi:MAG: glycoside hydrolase family 16 protein [Pseudomonadota bacterium]